MKLSSFLFENFDIEEFLSIKDPDPYLLFKKRVEWLKSRYQRAGVGDARIVFYIGNNKVLKLTKESGKEQSKNELEVFKCFGSKYVPKIFDYAKDFSWIVSEVAERFSNIEEMINAFQNSCGVSKETWDQLKSPFDRDTLVLIKLLKDKPEISNLSNHLKKISPWFNGLLSLIKKCNVEPSDIHDENTGIGIDGRFVILDTGSFHFSENLLEDISSAIIDSKSIIDNINQLPNLETKKVWLLKNVGQSMPSGSTRIVWDLGDSVLKLARSHLGIEQNKSEINLHKCLGSIYFSKILNFDDKNYHWLVMEKVDNNRNKKIKVLLKMFPNFNDDFYRNLDKEDVPRWFSDKIIDGDFSVLIDKAANQEVAQWVVGLKNIFNKCHNNAEDLHQENLGIRPATGLPVFFDYADYSLIDEQNSLASGNVVGYTAPLGATGIGTNKKLEKGFWRDQAGKKVKTASPALHEILEMEPSFVYHGTNYENAFGMQETGFLEIHKPWFGTEQETWPDGSTEKRAYFSATPKGVEPFYPLEGKHLLIRIPKTAADFKIERSTGDIYSKKKISIQKIEYFDKNTQEWKPLINFGKNPVAEIVQAVGIPTKDLNMNKGLWQDKEDTISIKEIIKQIVQEETKDLMSKMGYKFVGNNYRLGSDTYIQKDDPDPKSSKKYIKMANKNINKGKWGKKDTLHDPPAIGISLPKNMKG